MARTASRTTSVYTRVDPEIKQQAEAILSQLGIPMSNAVDIFLRQVVIHRGIPFDMVLPSAAPLAVGSLTKEQFDAEMRKGIEDMEAGRVIPAEDVEARIRSRYRR